jgi:hypothetical protein
MGIPMNTNNEKPSVSETKEPTGSNQDQAKAGQSTGQQEQPYQSRTKTEAELAAEKVYEERMEEEYAKREGGA